MSYFEELFEQAKEEREKILNPGRGKKRPYEAPDREPDFKISTTTAEQTTQLGRQLGERLQSGDIIAFSGGLGAGKTTFTQGISAGIGHSEYVTSPTFSLVNEYRSDSPKIPPLIHFDMYRVAHPDELYGLGFYDYMEEGCVIVIEWSENITKALPESTIKIEISRRGIGERVFSFYTGGDERFEDLGD